MIKAASRPREADQASLCGAYGFAIHGLPDAREWMQPTHATASSLRVAVAIDTRSAAAESRLDATRADIRLVGGGRLRMRKGDDWVRFSFPDARTDGDVLHPFLAPAAALAHLWAGREGLHGGAFVSPAGAVALLADKEGGKSTSLAWLATEHCVPVLADDLVVVAHGAVLAGPRCLDLRPTSLLKPPVRARVRRMRKRGRLRLTLAPAPGEVPLAAIVVLRFGQRVTLRQVPPLERLGLLLPNRMFTDLLPGNPATILDMVTLPMLVLTRPRGGAGLRNGAQALVDYFS